MIPTLRQRIISFLTSVEMSARELGATLPGESTADLDEMLVELRALIDDLSKPDAVYNALEDLVLNLDPPPAANCSCHISPPCHDCVENGGYREMLANAKEALG